MRARIMGEDSVHLQEAHMLKKVLLALAVVSTLAISSSRAQMQLDPNNMTPEQQQMMQEMQDLTQQIQQNIQNSGMDPQELAGQFQQAMQNGTDPMESITQLLINNGLMSPDQLN